MVPVFPLVFHLALGANLNLGIYMADHLLKDDINLGASFMSGSGNFIQRFTAKLAILNFCNLDCLCPFGKRV